MTLNFLSSRWCRVRGLSQSHSSGTASTATFRSLGIRPAIVAAIEAAFPNVQFPTESQRKYIPAVMGGYDVLLKDDTGTGKSVCLAFPICIV